MDLPTYTNIWRIEKRLYKLYDFRLPMPLPINWIAVFAGITIPYIVLLIAIGLPFNHSLVWLYVLPPGVLTWLTTRPVIEGKRLPELLQSQARYLAEPRTLVRLGPFSEKDQMAVTARAWRSRRPERPAAPAVPEPGQAGRARRPGAGPASVPSPVPALTGGALTLWTPGVLPRPVPAATWIPAIGLSPSVTGQRRPAPALPPARQAPPAIPAALQPAAQVAMAQAPGVQAPAATAAATPAARPPAAGDRPIEGVPVRARGGAPDGPERTSRRAAPRLEVSHDRPSRPLLVMSPVAEPVPPVAPASAALPDAAPPEAAPQEAAPQEPVVLPGPVAPEPPVSPDTRVHPEPPVHVQPPVRHETVAEAPEVTAVEEPTCRRVPSIERALSGPARDRALSWHGKVKLVTGNGATAGPGARDQEALDRNRARLPIGEPRRILVLGCTSGAGQTVTTLLTAAMLASLREQPVAAVDLHDGALARYRAPAAWLEDLLGGQPPRQVRGGRPDGLHPTSHPNPGRLDVIASHDPLGDGDEIKLAVQLNRHYPLAVVDSGAAGLNRLLTVADQLVVVVPASAEAGGALADTRDWLDNNGHAELAMQSVTVLNGVSRRSLPDVTHAESIARGRSRAIVRVPWDDMLPVAATGPATLRPQTRVAYTALAGVLVAGMAAAPVRKGQ